MKTKDSLNSSEPLTASLADLLVHTQSKRTTFNHEEQEEETIGSMSRRYVFHITPNSTAEALRVSPSYFHLSNIGLKGPDGISVKQGSHGEGT